ncbi:SDR family oxidoreductase [Candidatus Amesbacteria bacterium]|nr:SDR family oxidoreductase [Candidatus Amesbacteria bacterium]
MGQVALVTGASSILGQSIVSLLASRGYSVYSPGSSQLDITSQKSCAQYIKKHKSIDILINVAGISPSGPLDLFSAANLAKTLAVNTVGPFRLMSLVLPGMLRKKFGRIINVASLSALVPFPNYSIYSASKFALRALGLSARHELISRGVYVTTVCPGALASSKEVPANSARNRIPFLRWLLPFTPPAIVAAKITSSLDQPQPPAEIIIGRDAVIIHALFKFLPALIWHRLQSFVWQKQQ